MFFRSGGRRPLSTHPGARRPAGVADADPESLVDRRPQVTRGRRGPTPLTRLASLGADRQGADRLLQVVAQRLGFAPHLTLHRPAEVLMPGRAQPPLEREELASAEDADLARHQSAVSVLMYSIFTGFVPSYSR
ncbi:hypothetical protein ABZ819_11345 [Streptomyces venezuelae]|uniref:hypothetical protein n=1 Tax=Streptomyces venezuelae TaxID=54571 RepID=UPI00343285D5